MLSEFRRPAFVLLSLLSGLFHNVAVARTDDPVSIDVDAREVIRKMDAILRGDASFGAYRMTIVDPDWQRMLTFNAWEKRADDKTFIEILSPLREAGMVMLKIGRVMWNYLPRVERIVRLPPPPPPHPVRNMAGKSSNTHLIGPMTTPRYVQYEGRLLQHG